MSLEFRQLLNNELLAGAAVLGAGRTLGFSDDETIQAKRATQRREQRRRREQRGEREGNRAAAEAYLAQSDAAFQQKARATDSELRALLNSDVSANINDEDWAFGEDIEYDPREQRPTKKRRRQDDDQTYSREEKIRNQSYGEDYLTDLEVSNQNEGRSREVTGISGMRDALGRLEQAKQQYGFAAFGAEGAEMERLYYRLKEDLGDGQEKIRMQSQARAANNRDQMQVNVLQQARVELNAQKEAEQIAKRLGGMPRQLADQDIGRIGEVRSLGGAGHASHDPDYRAAGNYQVIKYDNPADWPEATPLVQGGKPIAYFEQVGDKLLQLGNDVNLPDNSNVLNAPKPTPSQSWVSQYLPTYGKPGGTTFGYPQVGINEEMGMLGERIRGMGYGFDSIGNPRSLADFEKAMGAIVGQGQKQGDTFWRFDPEARKTVAITQPGVDDVLYKLGYTDNEKGRLANALFQSQAAQVVDVNQGDKQAFYGRTERPTRSGFTESVNLQTGETRSPIRNDVNMDVAEMRPDQGTALDKIKNEKVGRGKKQKGVRAELAKIGPEQVVEALAAKNELMVTTPGGQQVLSPEAARAIQGAKEARGDAQMPLYGNIAGDQVDKARYIRGTDRNTGLSTLVDRYGAKQGEAANEVERRHLEDQRLRGEAAGRTTDPIAVEQRRRDADIAEVARRGGNNAEDMVIGQLVKDMKYGREFNAPDSFVGDAVSRVNERGEQINPPKRVPGARRGEQLRVPGREAFVSDDSVAGKPKQRRIEYADGSSTMIATGKPNFRRPAPIQPTRVAPVVPPIAPDPGSPTGNQSAPMIDSGMGGQQPPRRPTAVGGPMPDDMRNELFSLPDRGGNTYMTKPEGTQSQARGYGNRVGRGAEDAGEFAKKVFTSNDPVFRRNRRTGYAVGGAAAVLGTILNMGNNKEEEEQQVR